MRFNLYIIILLILCGCSKASIEPEEDISGLYPLTIVSNESITVGVPAAGEDPQITVSISRASTDKLSSISCKVNTRELDPVSYDLTLGKTWDEEGIINEVVDLCKFEAPDKGSVTILIEAEYVSGTIYKPTITYVNNGKY